MFILSMETWKFWKHCSSLASRTRLHFFTSTFKPFCMIALFHLRILLPTIFKQRLVICIAMLFHSFSYIVCDFIQHHREQNMAKNRTLVNSYFYFKFYISVTEKASFSISEPTKLPLFFSEPTKSPLLGHGQTPFPYLQKPYTFSFCYFIFFQHLSQYKNCIDGPFSRHQTHLHFIYFYHVPQLLFKYPFNYFHSTLHFCNFHMILHLIFFVNWYQVSPPTFGHLFFLK